MIGEIVNTINAWGIEVYPLLRTVVILLVLFSIFSFVLGYLKRKLISKAKAKRTQTDIRNFSRLFKVVFGVILAIVGILSYVGSFASLGVAAGLLTAALGWALQRPITGVAAWIMVIIKHPFIIGDRVHIGDVKGDVKDITLTHIVLEEVGGLVDSDVVSGRIIMIPNYLLYELNIINYTQQNDFVIGEVLVQVTYESDLDKALAICKKAALKYSKEVMEKVGKDIILRVEMGGSGVDIKTRFYYDAHKIQEMRSNVAKEIYDQFKKTTDVEIAYPHTHLVYSDKTRPKEL